MAAADISERMTVFGEPKAIILFVTVCPIQYTVGLHCMGHQSLDSIPPGYFHYWLYVMILSKNLFRPKLRLNWHPGECCCLQIIMVSSSSRFV